MKTFIIAELGSAWRLAGDETDLHHGLRGIWLAAQAGADACKFQWTSDSKRMAARRRFEGDPYRILQWPREWLPELAEQADSCGIKFLCTAFLPEDVAVIAPFIYWFKVASLEAQDTELIDTCLAHHKRVLVSTGCLDNQGVTRVLYENTEDMPDVLHCTAAYPAPPEAMNLRVLEPFAPYAGLSDHSGYVLTGALAVACGAEVLEVHLRLDETQPDNPDYAHSHCPVRFAEYVQNVRLAERMLGKAEKRVMPCEEPLLAHRVTT